MGNGVSRKNAFEISLPLGSLKRLPMFTKHQSNMKLNQMRNFKELAPCVKRPASKATLSVVVHQTKLWIDILKMFEYSDWKIKILATVWILIALLMLFIILCVFWIRNYCKKQQQQQQQSTISWTWGQLIPHG